MKYIFTDVDGTIYNQNNIILDETKSDILYAQNNGYEVILATGNPYFSKMNWLMDELNINYIICSNGASIFNKKNQKFEFTSFIDGHTINKIMKLAKSYNIFCDYWNTENIYISTFDNDSEFHVLMNAVLINTYSKDIVKLSNDENIDNALKIETYGPENKIRKFYANLKKMNLNLQIAYMTKNHIEITKHNVNKASAIKQFLKNKNTNIKKCMTIGDSANDEIMLLESNYSYAMGNAPSSIKQIAKFQTKDVTQNGLGIAIRDYISRTSGYKK